MAGVGLVIIDPRSSKSTFGANSMSFGRVGGGYWVPFGPCLRVLIQDTPVASAHRVLRAGYIKECWVKCAPTMPTVAEWQNTKQQVTSTSKSATVAESPRPDGSNFGKSFGCSGGADQPPTATQARVPPR